MSKPVPQSAQEVAILAQGYAAQAQRYFDRHGYAPAPALPAPDPELCMVVVVPAMAEPDAVQTLESLAQARRPPAPVEVLLVVNAGCDASAGVRRQNEQTLAATREWAHERSGQRFSCHVLDHRDLPAAQAGVGLARKLGLDTGLERLAATRSGRGILLSLDADCTVAPGYLVAVGEYFERAPQAVGATIYFEHPVEEAEARLRPAIVDYELHLRCYCHGLRAAGSHYACYTLGSAFAVRSEIYAQEGGMNRRRAGEDFYFLNKLIKRGPLGDIAATTVFPAARISDRVPFGTGAALQRSQHGPLTTYAPEAYLELKSFLAALHDAVLAGRPCPRQYAAFLDSMGFPEWLSKTRDNVASDAALSGQLRRWLDGFRTMKFVNQSLSGHDRHVAVRDAARTILNWNGIDAAHTARDLLAQFRALDRAGDATTQV